MAGWRAVAVVASVTAVAASACGGEAESGGEERLTKAEYEAEIQAVIEDSAEPNVLYTDLVVEPMPRERCAAGVAELEEQIGGLVDRIAALRPPAEVEADHADFIASARTSVDRIGTIREQVEAGDLSCGRELNSQLYDMPSTREAERAIASIERRGYYVFGE